MHRELGKSMVAVQHLHDACDPAGLNPAVFRKFFYVSSRACLGKLMHFKIKRTNILSCIYMNGVEKAFFAPQHLKEPSETNPFEAWC
eukprot:COSAG06_NODE_59309_length_274_cov_1.177143_1_plen_86_part_01